jgi:glutamyl-tRNA(Gln) amidotransferase subunit E
VIQVSVEEDSCREVSDCGHLVVWRTDRLGMPLIETVTGPELRTPDEVAEAILLVGRVCRSTGHVRVGMGASRQDVNVSVRGGRRVEIKGVPRAGWAPGLVHGEAVRQVNLLALRDELHRLGFKKAGDLHVDHHDVTSLFESSQQPVLRVEHWDQFVRDEGRRPDFELGRGPFCVRAVKLKALAQTLNWPTQPYHTFAHELAGRVRVVAGLDMQPILLHSEKWPDYEDSQRDLRRLKRYLRCGPEDGVVVVWGPTDDTITAASEVQLRYADALDGVPNETRQPFADGSTDFERILPGPDRMYPDTDSPPIRIKRGRVAGLKAALPPPPWEREKRYAEVGVPRDTIYYLIRRNGAALVDRVVTRCGADLRQACFFFGERIKGLRRNGVPVAGIPEERWIELFELLKARPVLGEAWPRIIGATAAAPYKRMAQVVAELGLNVEPSDWRQQVKDTARGVSPDHGDGTTEQRIRFIMGLLMRRLRGRVPAIQVLAALAEETKDRQPLTESES